MRRIYFLVPDIATTKRIVDDPLLARIEERHSCIIKRGTELEDCPRPICSKKRFRASGGHGLRWADRLACLPDWWPLCCLLLNGNSGGHPAGERAGGSRSRGVGWRHDRRKYQQLKDTGV
jgi:hypothetical protein